MGRSFSALVASHSLGRSRAARSLQSATVFSLGSRFCCSESLSLVISTAPDCLTASPARAVHSSAQHVRLDKIRQTGAFLPFRCSSALVYTEAQVWGDFLRQKGHDATCMPQRVSRPLTLSPVAHARTGFKSSLRRRVEYERVCRLSRITSIDCTRSMAGSLDRWSIRWAVWRYRVEGCG